MGVCGELLDQILCHVADRNSIRNIVNSWRFIVDNYSQKFYHFNTAVFLWSRNVSISWKTCNGLFQYEAALSVDCVRLVALALSKMVTKEPTIFRNVLRHGKFYNNGSEGIDCDNEPVQAWTHGHEIMKTMRDVSQLFAGLKLNYNTPMIIRSVLIRTGE